MKILCTGDLHLGRRSSRLPRHLDDRAHSAAACWERVVELALAESVAAVVVSGDLVDRANRFYEAAGPLEAGVRRLAAAGITTVAVAGNHDFDVLPRLAAGLGPDAFRLLGAAGAWERTTIRRDGAVLHLDGWSFPAQYVRESPVAYYDLPVPDNAPVLALLHADLEQPASPYAPVMLGELRARPVDFWLLGHVHLPALHDAAGATPVLYPGSPQALDPGETGAHGAWLLELAPGRRFTTRFVPLSSVRYDEVVVDLTGVVDLGEVDVRVAAAVRAHLESLVDDVALRCISCRLRVVGRTQVHRQLGPHLEALAADLELPGPGGATASVEKVEVATRPGYDLAELARGNDPVGLLARLLIGLDDVDRASSHQGAEPAAVPGHPPAGLDPEQLRLLRDAERAAVEVAQSRAYLGLRDRNGVGRGGGRGDVVYGDSLSGDAALRGLARDALARQAALLLDALLAQKEVA